MSITNIPTKSEPNEMNYICVDLKLGQLVFEYYHKGLMEDKRECFEEHLFLCFKCQETIKELDFVFEALRDNRDSSVKPRTAAYSSGS